MARLAGIAAFDSQGEGTFSFYWKVSWEPGYDFLERDQISYTCDPAGRRIEKKHHTTAVPYEYSVYGQVAASDPKHPNCFMFTGREFDADTGLFPCADRSSHRGVSAGRKGQ